MDDQEPTITEIAMKLQPTIADAIRHDERERCLKAMEPELFLLAGAQVLLSSLADSTLSLNNLRELAHEWCEQYAAAIRKP